MTSPSLSPFPAPASLLGLLHPPATTSGTATEPPQNQIVVDIGLNNLVDVEPLGSRDVVVRALDKVKDRVLLFSVIIVFSQDKADSGE